jgi:pyrroline-5-carboxylate reductase
MNHILGFIGSGNIGQAMLGGVLKAKLLDNSQIIVSDVDQQKLEFVHNTYGIKTTDDSRVLAAEADVVILAIKPGIYDVVLHSIKDLINKHQIIVTIAAGKSMADVESIIGADIKIVRAMPNTPALVNEGMTGLCCNENVSDAELQEIKVIFESFGQAEIISEALIDTVVGIGSSSPAYVFMFIEALADGGVRGGMSRNTAYKFAAQAVLGSAKMVLETGLHPGALKDMVCSPGGTTIESVASLENDGFRSAVIKAVKVCTDKSKLLSSK